MQMSVMYPYAVDDAFGRDPVWQMLGRLDEQELAILVLDADAKRVLGELARGAQQQMCGKPFILHAFATGTQMKEDVRWLCWLLGRRGTRRGRRIDDGDGWRLAVPDVLIDAEVRRGMRVVVNDLSQASCDK